VFSKPGGKARLYWFPSTREGEKKNTLIGQNSRIALPGSYRWRECQAIKATQKKNQKGKGSQRGRITRGNVQSCGADTFQRKKIRVGDRECVFPKRQPRKGCVSWEREVVVFPVEGNADVGGKRKGLGTSQGGD